jgi:hypothetical protein
MENLTNKRANVSACGSQAAHNRTSGLCAIRRITVETDSMRLYDKFRTIGSKRPPVKRYADSLRHHFSGGVHERIRS